MANTIGSVSFGAVGLRGSEATAPPKSMVTTVERPGNDDVARRLDGQRPSASRIRCLSFFLNASTARTHVDAVAALQGTFSDVVDNIGTTFSKAYIAEAMPGPVTRVVLDPAQAAEYKVESFVTIERTT